MTTNNLSVVQYVRAESVTKRVNDLLGKRAPQFVTSLITAVNENSKLAECEPQSVLNSALTAASMDLPINQNLGFAYLIPYKNKTGTVCQFQMGYKGFIQLAQRSGYYKTINVTEVKEGEIKVQDRLTGEITFDWVSDDVKRSELKTIGYIAYFRLLNGFEKSMFMSVDEAMAHGKKYSKAFAKWNSGLWVDDFDSMARKTVLKLLLSKYGPLNTQLQEAIQKDQTVNDSYADNPNSNEAKADDEAEKIAEKRKQIERMMNENS